MTIQTSVTDFAADHVKSLLPLPADRERITAYADLLYAATHSAAVADDLADLHGDDFAYDVDDLADAIRDEANSVLDKSLWSSDGPVAAELRQLGADREERESILDGLSQASDPLYFVRFAADCEPHDKERRSVDARHFCTHVALTLEAAREESNA